MKHSIKKHIDAERYCDCGSTRFKKVEDGVMCRGCKTVKDEFTEVPDGGLQLLKVQPKTRVSKFHATIKRKTWVDKFVNWFYNFFSLNGKRGEGVKG